MIGTPYQGLGPPSSPASPETYFWICIMISSKQSGFRRPRISEPSSSYNLHLPNTSSTIMSTDHSSFSVRKVDSISAEELASVTELLAAAYSDGSLGGEVYLAETKDNKKIIGVAMFDSPLMGHFKPELRREPFSSWAQFLPTYAKFNEDRIGAGVKKNNWHLQTLATHPDYQAPRGSSGFNRDRGFKVAGEPREITGLTGSFPFWVLIRKTN
ncbi:hypothetical protein BKA70DRAFT_1313560 [Coprinopsis sp. MPI-PUGE-AT-0042]|nr:hypothetical protein BKA70DRAFT_1313560 [Coprinopsis sp. MPI-PUGE-AT-0042]